MNPVALSGNSSSVQFSNTPSVTRIKSAPLHFSGSTETTEKKTKEQQKSNYTPQEKLRAGWIGAKMALSDKTTFIAMLLLNIGVTTVLSIIPPHVHGPLFFFPLMLGSDLFFRGIFGFLKGMEHPEWARQKPAEG